MADTLRDRIMNKDHDTLFTFLRVPGGEPTNNHAERSVRFLVIMRKICPGTRPPAGSESVPPSLPQAARRPGKNRIDFLTALLTPPMHLAREALLRRNDARQQAPILRHEPASSWPRPRRAYAPGLNCYARAVDDPHEHGSLKTAAHGHLLDALG